MERKILSWSAEEVLTKTLNVSVPLPLHQEFREAAIRENSTATGLPAVHKILSFSRKNTTFALFHIYFDRDNLQ